MNEYRLTRPDKYMTENAGKFDLSVRQGYYFWAKDVEEAKAKMMKLFPNDSQFDVELWKDSAGKLIQKRVS